MSARIITQQEWIDAVEAVLKERGPDFRYDNDGGCQYARSEDGYAEEGSCLFGAALIEKLDVQYEMCWESHPIHQILRHPAQFDVEEIEFDLDDATIQRSYWAQIAQDNRYNYAFVADVFAGRNDYQGED